MKCCKDKISKRILKRFLFVDFYLLIKKKENKALIFSFVRRFVLYFSTNVKSIHRLIEENCKKLDGVVTRVENRLRGGEERRRRKSKYPLPFTVEINHFFARTSELSWNVTAIPRCGGKEKLRVPGRKGVEEGGGITKESLLVERVR